ncbi:MAG TPA: endonuclease/exonuclease/phosphatase family protein [Paracoccaceae bacterium]|nr:endonuclease/exonuclease/phosphatase family protein [Paracoccaceae bacterium]
MMVRLLGLIAWVALAVVLVGFLGALHPALDLLGALRPLAAVLALAVVLAGAALRAWRAAAMAALALVVAGAGLLPYAVEFPPEARAVPAAERQVRVVSFNLYRANPDPAAAAAWLRASGADVILLQEVAGGNRAVREALADLYPHQALCEYWGGGVAVLSRLAEVAHGEKCLWTPSMAWMRVRTGAGELTVASVHLRRPWPAGQAVQVAQLGRRLARLERPILIGGDFNAMPWSRAVARLAEATRAERVPGLRLTFREPWLGLRLPIDHFLADPALEPVRIALGPEMGSDHLPLVADFALPQ